MSPCQNCGKLNTPETNFCRFCGTKYQPAFQNNYPPRPSHSVTSEAYSYPAPKPYAWKTDEFQTNNEARRTESFSRQPVVQQFRQPQQFAPPQYGAMQAAGGYALDQNYHCPKCGSSYLPVLERRISTAGWVVFSALLVFTLIFFWIGLLMKEDVAVCPVCRWRLN